MDLGSLCEERDGLYKHLNSKKYEKNKALKDLNDVNKFLWVEPYVEFPDMFEHSCKMHFVQLLLDRHDYHVIHVHLKHISNIFL